MPTAPAESSNTRYARIDAELQAVERWAKTVGVNVIAELDDTIIHVPDIWRDRSDPSTKGSGRVVLDRIIEIADRERLCVEIEHMTDEPTLGAYYASFGFKPYGIADEITNLRRSVRRN